MLPHPNPRRAWSSLPFALATLAACAMVSPVSAGDWIHWRGPEQNGLSREKGLPDSFDPKSKAKGNVVWSQPYGGRSTPLVMDGRLYINQGYGEGFGEAERVLCFEETTGKLLWEYKLNVYHADIVTSRLGWTSMTADPATGYVYNHATSGAVVCLDKAGKLVWERQLTEEFGRVSGYGGRIVSPIYDSGLVIVGVINSNWGPQGRGGNRFVALDGKSGQVVWWGEPGGTARPLTYQSNPIVAVIGGQRLLISGGAEGALVAMKVRTGEKVWGYQFAAGAINPSPVADKNFVYGAHGEENFGDGSYGRVVCVDASQIDPKTLKPKLVWEYKKSQRFGLSSPALADGRLYMPDDTGELSCFRAKDGKLLWKYRYGTEVRGAPLVADGRIYIFDVKGRMVIIPLNPDNADTAPNEGDVFEYKFRDPKGLLNETNGTPIAVNGRLYFVTRTDLFCVGDPKTKPESGTYTPLAAETAFDPAAKPVGLRIFPAELTAHPGDRVPLKLVFLDANGREVKPAAAGDVAWTLPAPPAPPAPKTEPPKKDGAATSNGAVTEPKTAAQEPKAPAEPKPPAAKGPPPLQGKVTGDSAGATLELAAAPPAQHGYAQAQAGELTARTRVRVAPRLPYRQDFTNVPAGAIPGGWVNAQGKFSVVQLPDGNKVLSKFNLSGPQPVVKANTYITTPDSAGYTMEADVMGTEVRGKLADGGIIASRYTLVLDGKTDPELNSRTVRLVSWEARPRLNLGVPFNWTPGTWYQMKLTVEVKDKTATVRGKVWKKGDPEPEKWTVEFEDTNPTVSGSAGLYGYVSNATVGEAGAAFYYDNVAVTPAAK